MTDPTYAEFKRKERELDMKYAGKDYDQWKPTNRRKTDKFSLERVITALLIVLGSAMVIVQIILWKAR